MKNSGRRFSVIIPVYNRPDELNELLACLAAQYYPAYEVIIVEDGSSVTSSHVVEQYRSRLPIAYYEKPNEGQGFSRNYGMARANGDFFVILDSDALLEPDYLRIVNDFLANNPVDLYGGPDTDHPDFTNIQKAISYAMTSLFTTGGIRGKKKNLGGTFHPRSFNMGMSREVWEKTGGFSITRMGEDIIFSISAIKMGFRTALIPEAFIYHKRRTSFPRFFRQLKFFGRARINIARYYPEELKPVHFFPSFFFTGMVLTPLLGFFSPALFRFGVTVYSFYFLLIFIDAFRVTRSLPVAGLSVIAAACQLSAYGIGLIEEYVKKITEPTHVRYTGSNVDYPS